MEVTISFNAITNWEEFYAELAKKMELPSYFGNNIDALIDVITGETPRPFTLSFEDLNMEKYDYFVDLIDAIDELTLEDEELEFTCFFAD